jgi:hypothetical protein
MSLSKHENFSGLFRVYRHASELLKTELDKGTRSAQIRKQVLDALPEGMDTSNLEKVGVESGILPENEEKLKMWLFAPVINLLALSAELGLKALITSEKLKLIHPLNQLFDLLDKTIQENLENYVCSILKINNSHFTKLLSENANVFEEWRYLEKKVGKNASPSSQIKADFQFLQTFNDAINEELVRLGT